MPNRILRDGILTSERVCSLNWSAEIFYRRLMSVVDDFGRYTANLKLLRAALYPLQLEKVREADIERFLLECEKASLIRLYELEGKRYLSMKDFKQQARSNSKFPDPDSGSCIAIDTQLQADAKQLKSNEHLGGGGGVCEDGGGVGGKSCPSSLIPPPVQWLEFECHKIGLPLGEGKKFMNYFETNGWVTGKSRAKMKNWRSALAGWKVRWEEYRSEKKGSTQQIVFADVTGKGGV